MHRNLVNFQRFHDEDSTETEPPFSCKIIYPHATELGVAREVNFPTFPYRNYNCNVGSKLPMSRALLGASQSSVSQERLKKQVRL